MLRLLPRRRPVLLSILSCGCAEAVQDGARTVIRFTDTVRILSVAIPVLVVVGVLLIARRVETVALRRLIVCGALGMTAFSVAVVPSFLRDGVEVTRAGVWQTTGFWFAPTRKGFDYADVEAIEITMRTNRDWHREQIWTLRRRDGRIEELDPGDVWEQGAPWIVPEVRRAGVAVH